MGDSQSPVRLLSFGKAAFQVTKNLEPTDNRQMEAVYVGYRVSIFLEASWRI